MEPSVHRRLRGAGLWVVEDHLLVSRAVGHTRWAVVGGGVEPGESAYLACVREFLEELGVEVRCERLAMVGDIIIRLDGALEQDVCFYFTVSATRETGGRTAVVSQEHGLEVAWIPLAEIDGAPLVPPSLGTLIPRALAADTTLYVTYDCRTDPDERRGTHVWP